MKISSNSMDQGDHPFYIAPSDYKARNGSRHSDGAGSFAFILTLYQSKSIGSIFIQPLLS